MTISKFLFYSFLCLGSLILIVFIGLEVMFWCEKFIKFIDNPVTKGALVIALLYSALAFSRES